MSAAKHWLTDAEARAEIAEREREEALKRVAALTATVVKSELVIQEQQDAIEEMHQAWLLSEGGGGVGTGNGIGSGCPGGRLEYAQLVAEVTELRNKLAMGSGPPGVNQALMARVQQADERAEDLERQNQELVAMVENRGPQVETLSTAMALVAEQTKRITELEGLSFERYQKIAELQMRIANADSVKAHDQAADHERENLLRRVQEAEAKAAEVESMKATFIQTEDMLRKRLKEEVIKDYTQINESFEKEYAAVRFRVSQAEMEARDAVRKAMAETQERQAMSKRLEELEAEHKKKLAEVDDSRKPEDRLRKLSSNELQVLKQRLNAAEARAGAAEAKMNQAERELASARHQIEEKETEARTAITEKAQVAAALEAARAANQGHMAETSQRLVHMARLKAERDMIGDQARGLRHGGIETEPVAESPMKGLPLAAVTTVPSQEASLPCSRSRMVRSYSAKRSFSPQRTFSPQRNLLQVTQSPAMATKSRASPVRMRPSVTAATAGGHTQTSLASAPTYSTELSASMTAHRERWVPRPSGMNGGASCQGPAGSRMSMHAPAVRAM
mmetsp:Transcript_48334/g.96095  ORF Transcript_48334/g.96095 Transcript_48334/m.96095 type:complete len:564 (+) Transcript_48334:46-1737(+)